MAGQTLLAEGLGDPVRPGAGGIEPEGHPPGAMPVVLRVVDDSDVCGVGVFTGSVEDTTAIMTDDPGVRAGVLTFDVHPCVGFPGDALP